MFRLLRALKRSFVFILALFATYVTYAVLITALVDDEHGKLFIPIILITWLFTAYVVLPRLHRRLVKIYLPDYFIGRTRTSDGLLGDPVNLAIIGTEAKLRQAMLTAGWIEAEPLTLQSSFKTVWASLLNRAYPNAPVSSLFLFGQKQQLAFQQEVDNSPHRRHHVRFWKTPTRWWLPGGYQADWIGAATYDRRIGLSLFTLQFTHKIEANIDRERDYVIASLEAGQYVKNVEHVKHYSSGFRSRNGGGDHIHTDGALPFVELV